MYRILALVVFCALSIAISGCLSSPDEDQRPPFPGTEVLHNVFDDGKGNVYIKVDDPEYYQEDAAIAEIMTKKAAWKGMFPDKKLVSSTIVMGDGGGYGHPVVVGLLIDYENV